jgi:predicted nucleotide-binding protein
MPKKPSPQPPDIPLYLTIARENANERITARIEKGRELKAHPIISMKELENVKSEFYIWSDYNEEMLRQIFTSERVAAEYRGISFGFSYGEQPLGDDIEHLQSQIEYKIHTLASVKERLELIPMAPGAGAAQAKSKAIPAISDNKVFIVHGHDQGVCETVARFIGKLGLTPIILHEQASKGRTVVEKLEHNADVSYAVVLLTPDDVGGGPPENLRSRARQNVVLELGYFLGRLGRERVCAIYKDALELPSDYMGVIYVPFVDGGAWRLPLAKELKAAGLQVDVNKAL